MNDGTYIWYVHDRFEQLRGLLELWGWEVVERGDLSEWDEGRCEDQVMGIVRIRGHWAWPDGGYVSFTIKEWWGQPPLQGPEEHHGFVLAGYHYTAQSPVRQVRHCYDTIRHPDAPFHVHPHGDAAIQPTDPITVQAAFQAFQQRLADEMLAHEDKPFLAEAEDTVDDVFGEADDD